jgi:hypothetical protein
MVQSLSYVRTCECNSLDLVTDNLVSPFMNASTDTAILDLLTLQVGGRQDIAACLPTCSQLEALCMQARSRAIRVSYSDGKSSLVIYQRLLNH